MRPCCPLWDSKLDSTLGGNLGMTMKITPIQEITPDKVFNSTIKEVRCTTWHGQTILVPLLDDRKHRRSKDDEVLKISKSVFVTNFPESISARDLWKSCSVYGTVVDVFIPSKKIQSRVYMVRAKELFTWNPTFLEYKEREYSSDVESAHASINNELNRPPNGEEPDDEFMNDEDGVSETIFGSSSPVPNHRDEDKHAAHSDDPFGLYDLLKITSENRVENLIKTGAPKVFNAQMMNSSQDISDIIRVGQVMGYSMEGCVKDLENIIEIQGEDNVIR
nr:RNA-directed DNA polymerase, eukaryota, nucleotide-binding alpha-beta plait domain protein [Tanacetum cinerariifolium]